MTSATDNRTTKLLREGLTERDIEWHSGLEGVTLVGDWCFVEYDNGLLAATCEAALTPEQAIAATLGEQIIRCRDCKHATISTMGVCKYCEMFVLPDTDGYGADPQVNLPLDFFCGFAERKEVD